LENQNDFCLLSVFYSASFRSIAFSLTRSDISAGNSLSVPQYTAIPLSYTDACFFCVFAVYLKQMMMMMMMMMMTMIGLIHTEESMTIG